MTTFLSAAVVVAGLVLLIAAVAWAIAGLVTECDADQGPPPTLRPDVRGLDNGLADYRAAAEAAYLEHAAEALVLAEKEQAVIHDRIVCERIEREEWRHG